MVTFTLPVDDAADAANGTPRPRPALPFARRSFVASPYGGSPARRNGVPHASSSRKLLATRDEGQPSGLNNSSIAAARSIFRSSAIGDASSAATFSPKLPQSAMRKVFAPGATPEPTRVIRDAMATPRGMTPSAADKELFTMRIPSPPPELTGEALSQQIPESWKSKGSIYADQFLSHLCPDGLDEEQRRQFFCILDLRRLKYAANEIFSKKDWKLNIINFAKEFEKSRSIILLRYGLYEFQSVKPSKDVLKRWRREHGLPDPEEDELSPSPSKLASSKKRKADDDMPEQAAAPGGTPFQDKRRALNRDEEPDATPAPSKNKRKASVSEENPAKMHKSTPSSAKSLFEKIASKPATPAQTSDNAANAKSNPFAASKPGASSLARSVLTNQKPFGVAAASAGGNIFGYISDASSAKNSGVDADAESDSEMGSDDKESPEAAQVNEPSVPASGTAMTGSQAEPGPFGEKEAPTSFGAAVSGDAGTRDATSGRSLFERVSKGSDGQPKRAEDHNKVDVPAPEKPATRLDQTWNPTTTPLKFAPSTSAAPTRSLFGGASTPASSFAPKATAPPSLFGAAKQDPPPAKESFLGTGANEGAKDSGESDKENESQPAKKAMFEPKAPAPATQPAFGSSVLSSSKPAFSGPPKDAEAPKPMSGLFGAAPKTSHKPEASAASKIFGAFGKTAEATPAASSALSTTLFGAKPAQQDKPSEPEAPKDASVFGGQRTASPFGGTGAAASPFGGKPATTLGGASGSSFSTPAAPLFGSGSSAFGSGSAAPNKTDAAPAAVGAPAKPAFSFGGASTTAGKPVAGSLDTAQKPLFGGTTSPPTGNAANGIFGGSPMKQDEPSAVDKSFLGGNNAGSQPPIFSFGGSSAPGGANSTGAPPSAPFGAAAPAASNAASNSFNFSFGAGGPSGGSFNNPFASSSSAPGASAGASFSFGATSSGPASGSSTPFQFGGSSSNNSAAPAAPSGGSMFGAGQPAAAPVFGGISSSGGAPAFGFSGAPAQPLQGTGSMFGSNQAAPSMFAGLQPPAGGSSTTGTSKSPFPTRRIAPLKRRV